ncbi:lysostaphin resistance A-like protein [Marinomonas sp. PE14-40]|uniref:CPBP family intramembrane glutamic endopeptidase n=1 Tax=Marinomonas sp. PE14-40 TaxID=3060621 RepID=UPI003F67D484
MEFLFSLFPAGFTWLLLGIAIITSFFKPKYGLFALGACALTALYQSHLELIVVLYGVAGLIVAAYGAKTKGIKRLICHVIVIVWALALALHLAPGFNNLQVLNQVQSGVNSSAYTLYLNLDKPLIFFALLLLVPNLLGRVKTMTQMQIRTLAALFSGVFLLAFLLGLIQYELSLPNWWLVFAFSNLLLTCVAEEALFRGYIQNLLTRRFNPVIGVGIASALFGLAHFAGGPVFILVATLAGILYGLTYFWSGKLSYAVAVHFAFNLGHLTFFTYPLLASS